MERREQGHALLHIKKSYKSLRIKTMRRWFRDKQILKGWPKYFLVVQSLGCVWLFDTPWTAARRASLSFTTSRSPPKFMSIVSVIQPSHPLSPASPPALSLSQHQGLSNESVLCIGWPKLWKFTSDDQTTELQLHHQSFQWVCRVWFPLRLTGLISLLSKGLSWAFSSTTVWRHQFFGALPSLWSSSHNPTRLLQRPQPWLYGSLLAEECLCFSTGCLGWS